MRILPFILRAMPMAVVAVLISGCAGSGYLRDLNRYARQVKGPDIASSAVTTAPEDPTSRDETETKAVEPTGTTDATAAAGVETVTQPGKGDVPQSFPKTFNSTTEATGNREGSESNTSPGTAGPSFNNPVSTEDRVQTESRVKVRNSERQPPEIDWGNNSRKDWFFLIMSGLGLIVGLFGVGFGWIVFLIFGGLFLYRKIVRRK
jgi:hypothetical protein